MKAKFIVGVLVLIIGFIGCTSSYYVASPGSSGRHHGYKENDRHRDRYHPDYHRNWHYRDRYRGPGSWRYRRW